jgi:hypothetical protein
MNSWTRWLLLVVVLAVGCNSRSGKSTTAESGGDGGQAIPSPDGSAPKKNLVPVKRNVKSIEGNWVVVVTAQRSDNYRWLIRFSRSADGKVVSVFLDTSRDKDEKDKPEIVSTEVDGDAIHISLKNSHGPFDFVGSFQQGFIRGTIRSSPSDVFLTRLLPTDETSLEQFGATGLPPGTDVFNALMGNKDAKPDDLLNTAREYKTSPLAQDIYSALIAGSAQAKFDEAKVKDIISQYLASAKIWGDRWEARVELNIAASLIQGREFSRMALPHLEVAEQKIGEDKQLLTETLGMFRDAANVNIRIQEIASTSTSEPVKTAAAAELKELLKKQRFNAEIIFALAVDAERTGKIDEAIDGLTDVVALPLLEATIMASRAGQPPDSARPKELLENLWKKKHGNDEGLAQHIKEVYQRKVGEYLAEVRKQVPAVPAADAGHQTVLVEMFTGMQCPPCVAADLALEALGKTYPASELIVIRHHQHIPLPDGLVNAESEERGAFYETGAAPTIVANGMLIAPRYYSGPMQLVPGAYTVLRKVVDPLVIEKTQVALQLSAVVTDGQLTVTASATGIPEDVLPSCRLRMAIVENEVHTYVAEGSNGIRDHEHVVREMIGGAKGIPPKRGELKHSETIPMAELKQHVIDHIARFEAGRRFEFPPEMKPAIQGPLSLVAWVQNDKLDKDRQSKLVLQAGLVQVTGDTGLEPVKSAEPSAGQHKPEAPGEKPEAPAEEPGATVEKTLPVGPERTDAAPAVRDSGPIPPPPALPE